MKPITDSTEVDRNSVLPINPKDISYTVVVNGEEQYSLWPRWERLPSGWHAVGKSGSRAECLTYIEEVWVDMRPLTVRRLKHLK